MRKKFALLASIFLTVIFLPAQKIEYGLNLGTNLTSMHGNGLSGSLRTGFSGGAFSRIHLYRKWALQPEINYNYTNTAKASNFLSYYVNTGYDGAQEKVHLSYISVPVLLGYKINDFITLNAGPQYSLLLYENDNLIKGAKAAFKRNDLGVAVGGQFHLENLSFYARYTMGVLNINDIDERYKWRNRQVQLGINLKLF